MATAVRGKPDAGYDMAAHLSTSGMGYASGLRAYRPTRRCALRDAGLAARWRAVELVTRFGRSALIAARQRVRETACAAVKRVVHCHAQRQGI